MDGSREIPKQIRHLEHLVIGVFMFQVICVGIMFSRSAPSSVVSSLDTCRKEIVAKIDRAMAISIANQRTMERRVPWIVAITKQLSLATDDRWRKKDEQITWQQLMESNPELRVPAEFWPMVKPAEDETGLEVPELMLPEDWKDQDALSTE